MDRASLLVALLHCVAGDRAQNCLQFTGSGYLRAGGPTPDAYYEKQAITVEAWVYPTSWGAIGNDAGIVGNGYATGNIFSGFHLKHDSSSKLENQVGFFVAFPAQSTIGKLSFQEKPSVAVELDKWTHLAGSYAPSKAKAGSEEVAEKVIMYKDGVTGPQVRVVSSIDYTEKNPLYIATFKDDDENDMFEGRLDEIVVWDHARSQADIYMDMYDTRTGLEKTLLSYWALNQNGATTTPDLVKDGKTATLLGTGITSSVSDCPIDQKPYASTTGKHEPERPLECKVTGEAFQFTVTAKDKNPTDKNFILRNSPNLPPGAEYKKQDPGTAYTRSFKWTPSLRYNKGPFNYVRGTERNGGLEQDSMGIRRNWTTPYILELPVHNTPQNPGTGNAPGTISTNTASSITKLHLCIRAHPEWIQPTPLNNNPIWPYADDVNIRPEHREEICANYPYTYVVKATDRNLDDALEIHFTGSLIEAAEFGAIKEAPQFGEPKYFAHGLQTLKYDKHTVSRSFSWKAHYEDAGVVDYTLCYQAQDNSGQLGVANLVSRVVCMKMHIRVPPTFVGPQNINDGSLFVPFKWGPWQTKNDAQGNPIPGSDFRVQEKKMYGKEVASVGTMVFFVNQEKEFTWKAEDKNRETFSVSGEACSDRSKKTKASCQHSCNDPTISSESACVRGWCEDDRQKDKPDTCLSSCTDPEVTTQDKCVNSCTDPFRTTLAECIPPATWMERVWNSRVWKPREWTNRWWSTGQHCEMFPLSCDPNGHTTAPDAVQIQVIEDPGLPNDANIGASLCPDRFDPQYCNPAQRTFKWKPGPGTEGKYYKVCATAKDDANVCRAGGWWSGPSSQNAGQVAEYPADLTGTGLDALKPQPVSENIGSETFDKKTGQLTATNVMPYTTGAENEIPLSSPFNDPNGLGIKDPKDPTGKTFMFWKQTQSGVTVDGWYSNRMDGRTSNVDGSLYQINDPYTTRGQEMHTGKNVEPGWYMINSRHRTWANDVTLNSCVDLMVVSPTPKFVPPTPKHMQAFNAHIGCEYQYQFSAQEEHIEHDSDYKVEILESEGSCYDAKGNRVFEQVTESTYARPALQSEFIKTYHKPMTADRCKGRWVSEMKPKYATINPIAQAAAQTVQRVVSWQPRRNQAAQKYTICMLCQDSDQINVHVHPSGAINEALKSCITIEVARCKYCIQDSPGTERYSSFGIDSLLYVSKYFNLDTNWMRLWQLNSHDDMDVHTDVIANPDELLPNPSTGVNGTPFLNQNTVGAINVGMLYTVQVGDALRSIASKFGTTVKKIIELNPDMTAESVIQVGNSVCLAPCTDPSGGGQYTPTYGDGQYKSKPKEYQTGATMARQWAW